MKPSKAQIRLLSIIKQYGECAEYWPVVNDWLRGDGQSALALLNINRTVAALERNGMVTIDENDGMFHLTIRGARYAE